MMVSYTHFAWPRVPFDTSCLHTQPSDQSPPRSHQILPVHPSPPRMLPNVVLESAGPARSLETPGEELLAQTQFTRNCPVHRKAMLQPSIERAMFQTSIERVMFQTIMDMFQTSRCHQKDHVSDQHRKDQCCEACDQSCEACDRS